MSLNTLALLCSARVLGNGSWWRSSEWSKGNIFLGLFSALLLWCIFFAGHYFMSAVYSFFYQDTDAWRGQIFSVYNNALGTPKWLIALLLVFPIASGEEIYWRAAAQKLMAGKYGPIKGLLITLAIYVLIHLPALNFALLIAAFICGLYWGLMYLYFKSIVPGLISHIVWDVLIFIIWPIA
ncbi:MAG: CPBP family intramembrane metalloprotease [Deltaproteobacteria bacterium]|nr:CPBP family intramembrane metalloprotease [Deltaproteobacteria bacterium]